MSNKEMTEQRESVSQPTFENLSNQDVNTEDSIRIIPIEDIRRYNPMELRAF